MIIDSNMLIDSNTYHRLEYDHRPEYDHRLEYDHWSGGGGGSKRCNVGPGDLNWGIARPRRRNSSNIVLEGLSGAFPVPGTEIAEIKDRRA